MLSIMGIVRSYKRLAGAHGVACLAASAILLSSVISDPANAQERICPDGKRSYFGVCPGETVLPGPIQVKIENLANCSESIQGPPNATLVEDYLTDKIPEKMYGILLDENRKEIVAVPESGDNLYTFKSDYYNFRSKELAIENSLLPKIGSIAQSQVTAAWSIYLRYFVMRASGLSQSQIKAGGDFLIFGITWDEAERVFGVLSSDPQVAAAIPETLKMYAQLSAEASKILAHARR
jgi:hypothetical protein